jgi:hypothetical protein
MPRGWPSGSMRLVCGGLRPWSGAKAERHRGGKASPPFSCDSGIPLARSDLALQVGSLITIRLFQFSFGTCVSLCQFLTGIKKTAQVDTDQRGHSKAKKTVRGRSAAPTCLYSIRSLL